MMSNHKVGKQMELELQVEISQRFVAEVKETPSLSA